MSNRYDHFDDILGDNAVQEGGGILDSAGLRDYEGIETSVVPEGAAVVLNCRTCNKKRRIIVEWRELVVLGENGPGVRPILPQGWRFSEHNRDAYVQMRCAACGQSGFSVHMTPEEAQTHVTAGLRSGLVQMPVVQRYRQEVARMRGGG